MGQIDIYKNQLNDETIKYLNKELRIILKNLILIINFNKIFLTFFYLKLFVSRLDVQYNKEYHFFY